MGVDPLTQLEMEEAMTDHKPLPVAGYTDQSDAKVALVNEFKADEERLLRKLDGMTRQQPTSIGMQLGEADQRLLAIGRTHLQTAFMFINRAVFQPQRINLPEDDASA